MRKFLGTLIFTLTLMLIFTGCTTTKSNTYKVASGDYIEVKLNTSGGYKLSNDNPFKVVKDKDVLSEGLFVTLTGYNRYIQIVNNDPNSRVIESDSKNGISYTFYSYNDKEYNYIIKINDSHTGLLLANPNSEEEARECFNRLTFRVKE